MTNAMRAVLVDDSDEDLKIAARLTRSGLPCDALNPAADGASKSSLIERIEAGGYDVVLLDYRLDDQGSGADYRGGTVAAELKERRPERPVVLVTTEQKLRRWVSKTPSVEALFDTQLLKEDLAQLELRKDAARRISNLVHGYRELARLHQKAPHDPWLRLGKAMRANTIEIESLPQFAGGTPPVGVAHCARWLLSQVLKYPAILLDIYEAAVRLGITYESFQSRRIQEWADSSRYKGVFGVVEPRWWRSRLIQLLGPHITEGSHARAKAIAAKAKTRKVMADVCIWCRGGDIKRACWTCKRAVDGNHCLIATVDERLGWAEPSVICFKCIQTGREGDAIFQPAAEVIVKDIKQGKIKPGS